MKYHAPSLRATAGVLLSSILCCAPPSAAGGTCRPQVPREPVFSGSETLATSLGGVGPGTPPAADLSLRPVEETTPSSRAAGDTRTFRGRVPPGEVAVVRLDPESGQTTVVAGTPWQLDETAAAAVDRAPAWLRDRLTDRLMRLDDDLRQSLAELILGVEDPRLVDEVAFAVAALSLDTLEDESFRPEALESNAAAVYAADEPLQYVELVDVGEADVDDDYHTTARYWMLDAEGEVQEVEIDRDTYYWYVAFPSFGSEAVTFVDPVTGDPADPEDGGVHWRSYFLDQGDDPTRRASTHFGTEYPSLIDDAMVSGWGPSAQGVLDAFEIDPLPLVVDAVTGAPTLVVFSYPGSYDDANVIATTMPLELAHRQGATELLDNMLRLGNASALLPESCHVAVIKDRDPWGEPTVVDALSDLGYGSVDVFGSDEIDELLASEEVYYKVVVPSAQPRALYEALADHREAFDEWLARDTYARSTVFQFHGAVDLDEPGDTWADLDLPGGFSCTDQATDLLDDLAVAGYPELLDVLRQTDHVVQWSDDRQSWSGSRPLDPDSSAVDLIGYFGSANSQDRCSEIPGYYRGPDGDDVGLNLDQTLRSPYAQRTLYLHFGNCGEAQDVLAAASRAALLPVSDVGGFVDDHVWNLLYVNGRWEPYTFYRSDGSTGFGGDLYYLPGTWAAVMEWRGDGAWTNRTAMFTETVPVSVHVVDAGGRPVDGAVVFTASDDHGSDPDTLVYATMGWTDGDGHIAIDLGAGRNYYLGVESPAGVWPGPEPNYVSRILTSSQCDEPGEEFTLDVELVSDEVVHVPGVEVVAPSPGDDPLALQVTLDAFLDGLEADNLLYGMRFVDYTAPGSVDLLLLDEAGMAALEAGEDVTALARWTGVAAVDEVLDLPTVREGEAYYLVASNAGRSGTSAFVAMDLALAGGSAGEPASTGGCRCAASPPRGHGLLVVAVVGVLVGLVRRRRGRGSAPARP